MGLPPGGHMEYTSGGPQYVTPDGKKFSPNGLPIDAGSAPTPQAAPVATPAADSTPAPAAATEGVGAPIGGLVNAAPTASGGGAAGAGSTGAGPTGMTTQTPAASQVFSGPSTLRQGMGQRNPPNLSPILTGLRSIY